MKTKLNLKGAMAFLMLVCTMATFTSMQSIPAENPVGTWNFEVETPDGTIAGQINIAKTEGEYTVEVVTQVYGTIELEDVTFKDPVMEASAELEGDSLEFEFEFEGDTMSGIVYLGEDELPLEAERKKN